MPFSLSVSDNLNRLSDKCVFPQSVLSAVLESHSQLPHPLIFRVFGPDESILVGVKEFTAAEGEILVPQSVYDKVGAGPVEIEVAQVAKATFLQVKPCHFYPHITNWKYYLESFLSKNYTTLSKKQKFGFYDAVAKVEVELQVEDANEELVTVVDTDITLDMVPLNDIMASQQLSHNDSLAYLENIPELTSGSSIKLVPFNQTMVPAIHKLNLRGIEGAQLNIQLTTTDDIYNVDLLAGLDKFVKLDNFSWCTMAQDSDGTKHIEINLASDTIVNYRQKCAEESACWLYLVPFAWEHDTTATLTIIGEAPSPEAELQASPDESTTQCSNCHKFIDKSKAALHEAFCFRNNVRCSCGEIFTKTIPSTHWHCDQCEPVIHGNSSLFKFKHDKLYHSGPYTCDHCDDKTSYPTFIELVENHQATQCGAKLHECMFCHLVVPQEVADYEDRFANLSHHENQCGNKTTDCFDCGSVVKTKDLASHMRIHYLHKVDHASEVVARCTNQNCVNILGNGAPPTNELGLCETCFGPLYAPVHDPTHSKLQARLERKYVIQLTKGCGHSWCENPQCANVEKRDIRLAIAHIHNDLMAQIAAPPLPINSGRTSQAPQGPSANRLWFCLNASVDLRRRVYDKIVREARYGSTMVLRAVAATTLEEEARAWLQTHSV